jgi:hypothetical protein
MQPYPNPGGNREMDLRLQSMQFSRWHAILNVAEVLKFAAPVKHSVPDGVRAGALAQPWFAYSILTLFEIVE